MAKEDIGELIVRIEADLNDFKKNMNNAVNILEDTQKRSNSLAGGIKNAFSFAGGFAIFETIKKGLEASVGAGLQFDRQMQQNKIALESMLGSTQRANQLLSQLQKMAAETPFELPELAEATKKMIAFGFEAEKVPSILKNVGDAAAGLGLGAEGVNRITVALGQMQAKGKVSGEEILQLAEAGVPALDILAKAFNTTTGNVQDMASKGVLPVNNAIDALITGMEERFPNMMDKQSKSFDGLMSTLKDNVQSTFGQIMKPAFDWLTSTGLPMAIEATKRLGDLFQPGGALYNGIQIVKTAIVDLINTITAILQPAINSMQGAFSKISTFAKTAFGNATNAAQKSTIAINETRQKAIDAVVKQYDDQKSAAISALKTEIDNNTSALNKIKDNYKNQKESHGDMIKTQIENEKKSNEEIIKSYNEVEKAKTKAIEQEINETKKASESIIKTYDELENARTKAIEKEIKDTRNASDTKIKEYDKEYLAKLKLIDKESYDRLKALQGQIDAINDTTDKEEEAIKKEEYNRKVSELKKKIASAKSAEDRADYEQDLQELIKKQERETLLEQRKSQIENLKDKIDVVKTEIDEKKTALKEEYDAKKENEKAMLETTIERLTQEKETVKTYYDDLKAKQKDASNAKIESLNSEKETVKAYYDDLKEKQKESSEARIEVFNKEKEGLDKYYESAMQAEQNSTQNTIANLSNQKDAISAHYENLKDQAIKSIEDQYKATDSATTDFNTKMESFATRLNKAFTDAFGQEATNKIFTPLMKSFDSLTNTVIPSLAKSWDGLSNGALKTAIETFGEIIKKVLPSLIQIIEFFSTQVIPALAKAFEQYIPTINNIVSNMKDLILMVVDDIVKNFETSWPYIKVIATTALDAIIKTVNDLIVIFDGLISFLNGVFTNNWEKIWHGIKQIVIGTLNVLGIDIVGIFNTVIDTINSLVKKLNKIKIQVPDWVPELGGKEFGFSIPEIPKFADGVKNFSGGAAIVGEQGPEIVNLPKGSDVIPNKQTQQMMGNINYDGMFTGANFYIRSDNDIKMIAREIYNFQIARSRSGGIIAAT